MAASGLVLARSVLGPEVVEEGPEPRGYLDEHSANLLPPDGLRQAPQPGNRGEGQEASRQVVVLLEGGISGAARLPALCDAAKDGRRQSRRGQ